MTSRKARRLSWKFQPPHTRRKATQQPLHLHLRRLYLFPFFCFCFAFSSPVKIEIINYEGRMGSRWWKTAEETDHDPKARLVREICSLSSAFGCCTHRRRRRPRGTATFVDWYLILRIDDSAGVDLVRRRYRHLALQLHPDKNKHPQAELAFKLVSEAYACLSDDARRRAFDSERRDGGTCQRCVGRVLRPDKRGPPPHGDAADDEEPGSDVRMFNSTYTRKNNNINLRAALEELRSRIREDAAVVENCLRARRQALRRVVVDQYSATSSPVFDPSDRRLYPDYPHHRIPVSAGEIKSYVQAAGRRYAPSLYDSNRGRCHESPVYEVIGAGSGGRRRCHSK